MFLFFVDNNNFFTTLRLDKYTDYDEQEHCKYILYNYIKLIDFHYQMLAAIAVLDPNEYLCGNSLRQTQTASYTKPLT
jgi:hypothetical protein